jgi:hypothetical protein
MLPMELDAKPTLRRAKDPSIYAMKLEPSTFGRQTLQFKITQAFP